MYNTMWRADCRELMAEKKIAIMSGQMQIMRTGGSQHSHLLSIVLAQIA
jgi:hypothetical protein